MELADREPNMTSSQCRAFIIMMMLVASPFLIAHQAVEAMGPGIPTNALDSIALGNTSDVQVPLKVSYAKNLGLTLDEADLGMVIGSSYTHQEVYLTSSKIGNVGNSTLYYVNASYQIVSQTDIGFGMGLPKEGNYSVNDDLLTAPREMRTVTGQIELRLGMYLESVVTVRDVDNHVSAWTGHLMARSEMTVKGSNLPVAAFYGDYTNLTYQDVNGSMRTLAGLNYSLGLDPDPAVHSSGYELNLTTNASLSMNLTGFIDAKGIPQNIQDELFGKTLASYGIFKLPVRFEDIGYLVQAINRHSLGNQTVPIGMTMTSNPTGDGLNETALKLGGVNATLTISTRGDSIVGIGLENPWKAAMSSLGLSLGSWDLRACGYDQAESRMNLTRGLMGSLPSTMFANDTAQSNATNGATVGENRTNSDLSIAASVVIIAALLTVAVIAYKRKR